MKRIKLDYAVVGQASARAAGLAVQEKLVKPLDVGLAVVAALRLQGLKVVPMTAKELELVKRA